MHTCERHRRSVAIQQTVGRVPRALLLCQSPDASPSHKGHLHHYCCEEFKIPEDREVFQPIRALHFALKQTEKCFSQTSLPRFT